MEESESKKQTEAEVQLLEHTVDDLTNQVAGLQEDLSIAQASSSTLQQELEATRCKTVTCPQDAKIACMSINTTNMLKPCEGCQQQTSHNTLQNIQLDHTLSLSHAAAAAAVVQPRTHALPCLNNFVMRMIFATACLCHYACSL